MATAPETVLTVTDDRHIAAVVALAAAGIPTDVQELLVSGDPARGIAPGAFAKAISASSPPPEPKFWIWEDHTGALWTTEDGDNAKVLAADHKAQLFAAFPTRTPQPQVTRIPPPQVNVGPWLDIAIAPKGTEILVWNGRRRHVAAWDKIEGSWVSSYRTATKRLEVLPRPTHWQPLPAEPIATAAEGSTP